MNERSLCYEKIERPTLEKDRYDFIITKNFTILYIYRTTKVFFLTIFLIISYIISNVYLQKEKYKLWNGSDILLNIRNNN